MSDRETVERVADLLGRVDAPALTWRLEAAVLLRALLARVEGLEQERDTLQGLIRNHITRSNVILGDNS